MQQKYWNMKHLLFIIISILLLTACEKDEIEQEIPIKRAVLIFMSAENNLSPYAQNDINEMITGRKQVGNDCDLLIYVDRASTKEKPFIARINNDSQYPVDTLYIYPEDFYSSNPANFLDVMKRMVGFSPKAKEYGLVLWGHANGWILENDGNTVIRRAYGVDNGDNSSTLQVREPARWLNIPDMAKTFQQLGIHWRFIFFDCCNMQNAEVAYELRNTTDYLIASPAEITGEGAPYDTMVKDFFIDDDEKMVMQMCIDYNAQFDYVGGHLPISAVDVSKMQALADATKKILPNIASYLKTNNPTQGIIYYYTFSHSDNEKIMYDMKDMIRTALSEEPEKYKEWETVFYQAVIYAETSSKWHALTIDFNDFEVTAEKFGGISMFFPLDKYEKASHPYKNDIKQMQWYQAVGWASVGR